MYSALDSQVVFSVYNVVNAESGQWWCRNVGNHESKDPYDFFDEIFGDFFWQIFCQIFLMNLFDEFFDEMSGQLWGQVGK